MGTSFWTAVATSTGTGPAAPPPPLPLPFLPPPPPLSASEVVDELHPAKASSARRTKIRGRVRALTGIKLSILRSTLFVHLHNGRVIDRLIGVTFGPMVTPI